MTEMSSVVRRPFTATRERLDPLVRTLAMLMLVGILGLIAWHIALKAKELSGLSVIYTVVVSSYVLSRFAMAALYRVPRDVGLWKWAILGTFFYWAGVRRTGRGA